MLQRRKAVAELMAYRGDSLVVSSLGNPTYDLAAAGDTPANFYLWGAMGGAPAVGLGLALAQPGRRVVVLAGDGEMMMALGSLATISVQRPDNLALLVLDNQAFAETGSQTGLTASGIDLVAMAAAAGFRHTLGIRDESGIPAMAAMLFRQPGPVFGKLEIAMSDDAKVFPEWKGDILANRTRRFANARVGAQPAKHNADL